MFESHLKPPIRFPSVSGSVCNFNSQYAGLPLKSHSVDVVATQSGSGTPSPSNPRPITGYSAINISHSDADTSNPTVYTIQIGSTVYGGEYDARTGVLTVTHGFETYDGINKTFAGAWGVTYSGDYAVYAYIDGVRNTNAKSNLFKPVNKSWRYMIEGEFVGGSGGGTTFTFTLPSTVTTITEANQWLQSNNTQVCFELATPTTIQLPPCPIDTLEGVNNIWADTGNTTLQYAKFG